MWHLRTKQGTFWVIETPDTHKYVLGVDDDELGVYEDADEAAKVVCDQATGHLPWDAESHVTAPSQVASWSYGEPTNWEES